jgi:hypothetical protein
MVAVHWADKALALAQPLCDDVHYDAISTDLSRDFLANCFAYCDHISFGKIASGGCATIGFSTPFRWDGPEVH